MTTRRLAVLLAAVVVACVWLWHRPQPASSTEQPPPATTATTAAPVVAEASWPSWDGTTCTDCDGPTDAVTWTAGTRSVTVGKSTAAKYPPPTSLENATVTQPMAGFTCPSPELAADAVVLRVAAEAEGCGPYPES